MQILSPKSPNKNVQPDRSDTEQLLPNLSEKHSTNILATENGTSSSVEAKKFILAFCLLISLIFLFYSIGLPLGMSPKDTYWKLIGKISSKEFKNLAFRQKLRQRHIILGWNRFWDKPVYEFRYLKWGLSNCSYECVYTEDKKYESLASVVMFHGGQPLGELPKLRRPKQLFTMVSHESPNLSWPNLANLSVNYFNVSITYRMDSTIYIPYEQLNAITSQTPSAEIWRTDEIQQRISLKRRLALQFVSNCNAPSGRDVLTKQLQKLMEFDVFGRCNARLCDNKCYQKELDTHFFYMAFENSVCPQYVTEKFWNALRSLVVPVVLSRSMLKSIGIPDDVYISADDFDSAQGLADYLMELQKDSDRYLGYFNWTKMYRKQWDHDTKPTALCQLCKIAHEQMRQDEFRGYTVQLDEFCSERWEPRSGDQRLHTNPYTIIPTIWFKIYAQKFS